MKIKGLINKIDIRNLMKREPISNQTELFDNTDNPYIRGRKAWNDLYGSQTIKLENAYRLNALLAGVIAIAVVGYVIVAGQSKVKPYIVEMQNGSVLAVHDASSGSVANDKIAEYTLRQFIINARSVSPDNIVEKERVSSAYAQVSGAAMKTLKDYLIQNDPFTVSQNYTVQVNIQYVLQLSPQTYQIEWTEVKRTLDGQLAGEQRYTAQLTYSTGSTNSDQITLNPFGIYITQLNWSATV